MYQESIEKVRHLLKSASDFIDRLGVYPRQRVHLDAVLLALLSRAIRVGEAVCLLVENDFGDEAFGLTRTMIEISLSARYMTNGEGFSRSRRYVEFFAKDHEGWTKIIGKYFSDLDVKLPPDHERRLGVAKSFRSPHSWSGLGGQARDMALEEDTFERDAAGNPAKWEFDYEVTYKWTSHFVHATVVSLDQHAQGPGRPFRVRGGRQKIEKGGMALFNAAMYLFKTFVVSFRGLNYEVADSLLAEFDETLKWLAREGPR